MSATITLLHLDHRKLAKVLDLVQRQVANMARRAPVDFRLLENAFQYLSGYPEQCHHPKEDLLYRKLLSRFPDMAESLRDLTEEHEKLAGLTQSLSRAIGESHRVSPVVDDPLMEKLRDFLEFYRLHMLMEERHFFPLALQRLSRTDFAEIDATLFDQPDHSFGREMEAHFAELHAAITLPGMADRAATDGRDEAAWLATFNDVASFNEAMQRAGEPIYLARLPEGGYVLEQSRNILVHIPACSESRAAWCAYFFWKATITADAIA